MHATPVGTARMIALCMLGCTDLASALLRAIEFNACCRIRRDRAAINRFGFNNDGMETIARRLADRGARVVHAQHLMVLAPAAPDPGACLDPGCSVPPICSGAAPCDAGLHAVPFTVGWHLPEVEE